MANLPSLTLENTPDHDAELLTKLSKSDYFDGSFANYSKAPEVKKLKDLKLVQTSKISLFKPKRGPEFRDKLIVKRADLTAEDLAKQTWKQLELFKELNLEAKGKEVSSGGLHPLMKMRSEFRQILLEMGFEEMKTNQFVESSFWNFDSLYQPQQHPARDVQDTFFTKLPCRHKVKHQHIHDYVEKVKDVHEKGYEDAHGQSIGWNYPWSIDESMKNILRTHTTTISSRYLKQLADEFNTTKVFKPKKLFSIDKVYRNETLDATHLAEFHQIEGVIVGKNLGLHHLKAVIREFFEKIGISQLRFKPAYNPYTEPSMEIFAYSEQLKKMVEVGNSGVFRPEMLKPMGWPHDVSVIAWGLSLERPAMIHFKSGNIRELVGPAVKFADIKQAQLFSF